MHKTLDGIFEKWIEGNYAGAQITDQLLMALRDAFYAGAMSFRAVLLQDRRSPDDRGFQVAELELVTALETEIRQYIDELTARALNRAKRSQNKPK